MVRGLVAVALALAGTVCLGRSYDDVIASGYIELAVYRDFPPYSYQEDGRATGVDIDIGNLIAAKLGVKPRWFWLSADETVDDDLRNAIWKGHYLERRVADLMLRIPYDRAYSYARDGYGNPRNDLVVMFGPYQNEQWVIARDLEQLGDVYNLAVFQYEKIGVELDSLPDFYLSGAFQGRLRKQVVHYPTVFQALRDLDAGKLSAVSGIRTQIEWGLGAQGRARYDIGTAGFESLARKSWDIGMAVKHTDRQLAYTVESIMEGLVRNGGIRAVFERYGLSYQMPELYRVESQASSPNP